MKSGGSIISIDLKGGKEASFRFLNALKLVLISNNLGDSKSLATHPMTTTHQRLTPEQKAAQGITPGLVRLSIGLEDVADLIADVKQAYAASLEMSPGLVNIKPLFVGEFFKSSRRVENRCGSGPATQSSDSAAAVAG